MVADKYICWIVFDVIQLENVTTTTYSQRFLFESASLLWPYVSDPLLIKAEMHHSSLYNSLIKG